jgi:hypothetical protein
MPPPPERRWPGLVAGYVALAGVVALAATPAYYYADPAGRSGVVRLALCVVLGVALLHLRRPVRARLDAQAPSAFERALERPRLRPELAPQFVKLREELQNSTASQAYFRHVLWPRLQGLAARRAGGASPAPDMPPGRRWLRRGPSLATLRKVIETLEERT